MKNKQDIISALTESNPWWKAGFSIEYKPRDIYQSIQNYINERQIIAITGMRRVGKTTIMLQMVQELLQNKTDNEDILFFSFDDFRTIRLKTIVETYQELLNKDLHTGYYYIFFDEIQKLEDWHEQLKRLYDHYPKCKIIISGSESLFIRKRTRESLAGRFFEFTVRQLTYKEFLRFKNITIIQPDLYREELLRLFNEFIMTNGFPELIDKSREFIHKYLKENVLERIIFNDIPMTFKIRETAVLYDIYMIIMHHPGSLIKIDDLAKETGITRQTLSSYLEYLQQCFLIRVLYNFTNNFRKTRRKLKKYYPQVILPQIVTNPDYLGRVFETVVVHQLNGEHFWRDPYKNEVDIIKKENSHIVPFEVKYSGKESKSLRLFMKKQNIKDGFIISYDKETIYGAIQVLPFYKYSHIYL